MRPCERPCTSPARLLERGEEGPHGLVGHRRLVAHAADAWQEELRLTRLVGVRLGVGVGVGVRVKVRARARARVRARVRLAIEMEAKPC